VNVGNEKTQSLWMDLEPVQAPRLTSTNLRVDAVVLGAGIAGLSTAYELIERGLTVAVIDRGKIGRGMTSRTTAHLTNFCDNGSAELIEMRGEDIARRFAESQEAGIRRIEEICDGLKIACNFRRLDGFLFPDPDTTQADLDDEMTAVRSLGIKIEKVHDAPVAGYEGKGVLRYRNQATFNPGRYLNALAETILARGGKLYADTIISEVNEANGVVTVRATNGESMQCDFAVVATNSPINDRFAIHSKMAPYRTYAMAFTIPKGSLPDALFWDTMDPYHYVRQETGPGGVNHLITGGEDHKSGEADDMDARFDGLGAWTRKHFPMIGKETHRWSGQWLETIDQCSFTGVNPGNDKVYVHTGDSGQGITHGAMAALLIADLITTGNSKWKEVYDPTRLPIRALTNYARENMTAIKSFAEYVAPGEVASYDELKAGQGAIVRDGLRKVAAYRDTNGRLHKCSAVCTHLGCHVHWNPLERCWDCPCHGSQFDIDGTALNAPAIGPLEQLD
jgi:glycine/D-amino acid oxidase-like deaminating enzyme/nitrite reductase/ring-hydroxylating ferredoxin subunit